MNQNNSRNFFLFFFFFWKKFFSQNRAPKFSTDCVRTACEQLATFNDSVRCQCFRFASMSQTTSLVLALRHDPRKQAHTLYMISWIRHPLPPTNHGGDLTQEFCRLSMSGVCWVPFDPASASQAGNNRGGALTRWHTGSGGGRTPHCAGATITPGNGHDTDRDTKAFNFYQLHSTLALNLPCMSRWLAGVAWHYCAGKRT